MRPSEFDLEGDGEEPNGETDDRRHRTDGGQSTRAPFEMVSSETVSRSDRYKIAFTDWVVAPAKIIWSDWRARVGGFIILLYAFMGTVGVRIVDEPRVGDGPRVAQPFQDMSYPLGTDLNGNDLFAQTVHATPPMLEMIVVGAVFTTILATIFGVISGYKGGTTDRLMMTFTDILLTIPGLPLVIVLAVVLDPREPWLVGIILSINAWAGLARAIRSQVLTIREEEFIEAARLMGISTPRILVKHVTPGLMPYILVNFVNAARTIIFASVALYFLGILPETHLNWGVMMNHAYELGGALYTPSTAHWLFVPMMAIILLSFGLILFAQGTDRIFNPRVRARHASGAEIDDLDESDDDTTPKSIIQ
ncbi:ABC transporter permease [Halomontanus rarus]|uniref:ABC transporter permease n=1 Tax=Halomontanus rarus TaxID=3034020 RepID=UPI0023E81B96|nr:ABC transporter permease [Halovivax sp. TS33]